jgi:hypothetical protein
MNFPKIEHEELIRQFENVSPKSILQMKEEVKQMELERIELLLNKKPIQKNDNKIKQQ